MIQCTHLSTDNSLGYTPPIDAYNNKPSYVYTLKEGQALSFYFEMSY